MCNYKTVARYAAYPIGSTLGTTPYGQKSIFEIRQITLCNSKLHRSEYPITYPVPLIPDIVRMLHYMDITQ